MRSAKLRCVARSRFAKLRSGFAKLHRATHRSFAKRLRNFAKRLRAAHRNFALRIATSRYTSQLRASQLRNFALHIIRAATVVLLGHHSNVLSMLLINLLVLWWSVDTMKRHDIQTCYSEIISSALQVGRPTFSVHRPHIRVGIR